MQEYIAHVADGKLIQSIDEHHLGVAEMAQRFADSFGAGAWGYLCGIWHDVGKYSYDFQRHIRSASGYDPTEKDPGKVDHASAGAIHARKALAEGGRYLPVSYCICGHHSGLPDYMNSGQSNLQYRLQKEVDGNVEQHIAPIEIPTLSPPLTGNDLTAWHLWVRMLYSSLVDADYLDTERFCNPEQYAKRGQYDSLATLKTKLDQYLSSFSNSSKKQSVLNNIRNRIQTVCRESGRGERGIYSLTVPTGGGKTLSSMVWAMEHALKNHCSRIIIAIPYTSIIIQTADRLRQIFGEQNVIEHHSNTDFDNLTDNEKEKAHLATENWDAPIIITTNVQLFESLYANRSSRCRKLHNIVNSVLILDEVQMLQPENLQPVVDVLRSLRNYFDVSILMTTATRPALTGIIGAGQAKFEGLEISEIISDRKELFNVMRRVDIEFLQEKYTAQLIAERLSKHSSVLCVVNRRLDAREVFNALKPLHTQALHLSRMMCQQHIMDKINLMRQLLDTETPVAVVSTQLIEAGVDVDFPVVYRAMAGLDSIAQAAGRCNREGRMERGNVYVFDFEESTARGIICKASDAADELREMGLTDFLDPDTTERYFKLFYGTLNETDKAQVKKNLYQYTPQFATAASEFRLIDDQAISIYVPYGKGAQLVEELKHRQITSTLLRQLQRFCVSIPVYQEKLLAPIGAVQINEGLYYLPDCSNYDEDTGLVFENQYLEKELIL